MVVTIKMKKRRILTNVGRRKQARKIARQAKKQRRNTSYKKFNQDKDLSDIVKPKFKRKQKKKKVSFFKTEEFSKQTAEDSQIEYFERKLGISSNKSSASISSKNKKLARELEKDGMDADFLSFLDGIGKDSPSGEVQSDSERIEDDYSVVSEQQREDRKANSFIPKNDIYGQVSAVRLNSRLFKNQNNGSNSNLSRRLNGLLNRLSVNNISPITQEVVKLYLENSRNDLNTALERGVRVFLNQQNLATNLLLPIGTLIAALASAVAPEVVTVLLEALLKNVSDTSWLRINFTGLSSVLYLLNVVSTTYLFSLLFWLLEEEESENTSLRAVLKASRISGFKIRQESPGDFKKLIEKLQGMEVRDSSFKKHLLDEVFQLKNRRKTEYKEIDEDILKKLSKWLKRFQKEGRGLATADISVQDLLNAERLGRWWIVGSSWVGKGRGERRLEVTRGRNHTKGGWRGRVSEVLASADEKTALIGKKLGMNTDVKKAIFFVIFSTADVVEAFGKINALQLGEVQEREIVVVLLKLNESSKQFNAFFAELLQKFCTYHQRFRFTIQLKFWDLLKTDFGASRRRISHSAELLAYLVGRGSIPLSVLKHIEFESLALNYALVKFLNIFFLELLDPKAEVMQVLLVFKRLGKSEDFSFIKDGFRLFFHQHYAGSQESVKLASKCLRLLDEIESRALEIEARNQESSEESEE